MIRYDPRLCVISQTFVWQRDKNGLWERHLIRRLKNGAVYWSPLQHVLQDIPCCLACLSHRVIVQERGDSENWLMCHDCGARYYFL